METKAMRYTTIDQASERARDRDLNTYLSQFDGPDESPRLLSDRIRSMDAADFERDAADYLLCDMLISAVRLRDLLADAQEQLEAFPGEQSAYFYSCASHITCALLGSLRANADAGRL
jgi:hypothetical protein